MEIGISVDRFNIFPWVYMQNIVVKMLGGVFEGSNDDINWTIIGEIDETIHSGWNTIKSFNNKLFRYIRYRHNSISSCNIA